MIKTRMIEVIVTSVQFIIFTRIVFTIILSIFTRISLIILYYKLFYIKKRKRQQLPTVA